MISDQIPQNINFDTYFPHLTKTMCEFSNLMGDYYGIEQKEFLSKMKNEIISKFENELLENIEKS